MGDPENITTQSIEAMAKSYNVPSISLKEGIFQYLNTPNFPNNPVLEEMFSKAATAWGQDVQEAKKNTLEMLRQELHH
jgi:hypothetical protein